MRPVSIVIMHMQTQTHLLSHTLHLEQIMLESYSHFSVYMY